MIREIFYDFFGYNAKLFFLIHNNTKGEMVQTVLYNLSNLFYFYNFILYFAVFIIYVPFRVKNKGPRELEHYWRIILRLGTIYSIFMLVFAFLKFTTNMIRPICLYEASVITSIIDISKIRCLSSFPSAHSGMALFCAYSIWPYLNKIHKAAMLSLVILTGIGRVSLGMHFPADILYGYLISITVIIVGNLLHKNIPEIIHNILYNIFNIIIKAITRVKKT